MRLTNEQQRGQPPPRAQGQRIGRAQAPRRTSPAACAPPARSSRGRAGRSPAARRSPPSRWPPANSAMRKVEARLDGRSGSAASRAASSCDWPADCWLCSASSSCARAPATRRIFAGSGRHLCQELAWPGRARPPRSGSAPDRRGPATLPGSCCRICADRSRWRRRASPAFSAAFGMRPAPRRSAIGPGSPPASLASRSMNCLIWLSGRAPTKPSTGWPWKKAKTAGIDWMRSCAAICGFSSMLILTSRTVPRAALHRLLEQRPELLARAAPGRPEIDDDRHLRRGVDDVGHESAVVAVLDQVGGGRDPAPGALNIVCMGASCFFLKSGSKCA